MSRPERYLTLGITKTWDGGDVMASETAFVRAWADERHVWVDVDAPHVQDPPPPIPSGRMPRLWDHEVVELFLLGKEQEYLELELGPYGHYLVLQLKGSRNVVRSVMLIGYSAEIEGRRWRGRARFPVQWLPPGVAHGNAYRMCGPADARKYFCAFPGQGGEPDFHQLECFGPILVPGVS